MCVAWIRHEIKRGHHLVSPYQGAKDGPAQPYSTPRPHGRGSDCPLLSRGRGLRPSQPSCSQLRVHKAPCGLRSHRPRSLPAASGRGERTLFLAGCPAVLLSPVSGGGWTLPFLLQPAGEQAQTLFGSSAAQDPPRTHRRAGNSACGLDVAGSSPSASGFSVGGLCGSVCGSGVGKVGIFLTLRSEAAPALCATKRVPICYELTAANLADISLTEELIAEAALGEGVARRLLAELAYRSEHLREALAEVGILLATEPSERRHGMRQQIEIAILSLKRVFGLGETLATTLVGLAMRFAAKICSYTYAFYINRVLGRPQGHIKELWA